MLTLTKGTGLSGKNRWVGYFLVIEIASMLSVYGYENWHKMTGLKIILIIGNLFILGYLMQAMRQDKKNSGNS